MATNSDNFSGARNSDVPGSTAVAQLVEQRIPNPQVAGSSPSRRDSEDGSSPIYKPGQGFWVRLMTATLAALLIVAGAGWIWTQLGVVKIPTPKWSMSVRDTSVNGAFPGGTGKAVELLAKGVREGEFTKIGDAAIIEWKTSTSGHDAIVDSVVMSDKHVASETAAIRVAGGASPVVGVLEGRAVGIPIFQPVYLQAAGAGLLLVLGAIYVFWQVGLKPRTVDFLIATDAEMKKVNWSTRREVTGITQVVIVAFFMIAGILFVIDVVFNTVFSWIHVIRTSVGS